MIFVNPQNPISQKGSVVTMGSFDGVHLGHREILNRVIEIASQRSLESTLMTFFPHPRKVLNLDVSNFGVLNTLREKELLIESAGINNMVELEFTKELGDMEAEEYVKHILCDMLQAKVVVIGYDHKFGKGRSGDIKTLQLLSEKFSFEVIEVAEHNIEGCKISSTEIRKAMSIGDLKAVAHLLGYQYFISIDKAIDGAITLSDPMKLLPPDGRYKVEIEGVGEYLLLIKNKNIKLATKINLNIETKIIFK